MKYLLYISLGLTFLIACQKDIWEGRFEKERKLRKAFKSEEAVQLLYGEQLKVWDIQAGDVVADIGSYDGVVAGLISMYSDSATIYIQDIDTSNFHVFPNKIQPHFEGLRGRPFTNEFEYVAGTYDTTNLPHNTFNKIILNNVFHYIPKEGREDFLKEMHLLLKDSGYFYVRTPLARNEDEALYIPAEDDLVNSIVTNKFQFIEDHEVMHGMNYIFVFQKSDRNGRIRH